MSVSTAPVLSTAQEDELFAKVESLNADQLREKRRYLGAYEDHQLAQKITNFYSLDALAKRLVSGKWNKIALQFPDNLICDSAIVSQILQNYLDEANENCTSEESGNCGSDSVASASTCCSSGEKTTCCSHTQSNNSKDETTRQSVWILADTSYSPCCLDTIAAEHSNSTHVVHFGDACLNPVSKLSSTYVFGKPCVNVEAVVESILPLIKDESKVCLMSDAPHTYCLSELKEKVIEKLGEWDGEIVIAELNWEKPSKDGQDAVIIDYPFQNTKLEDDDLRIGNRVIKGLKVNSNQQDDDFDQENDIITQEYTLIHLTTPPDSRMLLLSTKFSTVNYIEPQLGELLYERSPNLMKRYRFMHEARSASTVGILLNTLSLSNTLKLMNLLIKWIKDAGKKHYLFTVGKPNVAKLANFECVDVWCVIGCGQGGVIVDQFNEYWRPIVTPYELWLALAPEIQWQGKWVVDFDDVLNKNEEDGDDIDLEDDGNKTLNENANENNTDEDYNSDDNAPEFNPVTGKLSLNKPLRQLKHLQLELDAVSSLSGSSSNSQEKSTDLVKAMSGQLAVKNTISMAAMHLQGREWRGLGSDYKNDEEAENQNEGALVQEGRSGIARDYGLP
ncbi:2-(3-amino-3-carboxypropyl)histidine synthase [Martiniozyma asiatica (nom. inval.)]|nr:2-(3-amino-3-carboxypropyl)histidine synthase [Martiniozyma asiatica]